MLSLTPLVAADVAAADADATLILLLFKMPLPYAAYAAFIADYACRPLHA